MGFNQLDVAAARELMGISNLNKNKRTKEILAAAKISEDVALRGINDNIQVNDFTQAVNRYEWFNLPEGLNGQLIEKMLYFRGQLAMFYVKENQTFYILPYTLNSEGNDISLDCYGRFTGIKPIMFNGSWTNTEEKAFNGKAYKPFYDVFLPTDDRSIKEAMFDGCVILKDYTSLISERVVPRCQLSKTFIDMESEALPMARTSLLANSGIQAIKVPDSGDSSNVMEANEQLHNAAITGKPFIPIVASVNTEQLTAKGTATQPESFFSYMQVLDNLRLASLGLDTGGIFQKSSQYQNLAQTEGNMPNTSLVYQDGLIQRQRFCNIVNSIWGLGIWCDEPEVISLADKDMNGELKAEQESYEGVESDVE